MAILVTGGAGFIGSHTCVELLNAGYEVVVLDNLVNASEKSLERVKAITGKEVTFYKGDILDRTILNEIFEKDCLYGQFRLRRRQCGRARDGYKRLYDGKTRRS